ncbi:chromosome partitioning protein ParB [Burkholderia multivorans]|uniref:ParB/RepB/Spo0J family partition protein n=1 Tax=Burkholderia multivorans TaxID=87883 RepID=UPI000758B002|nr:ParB/RepB/Spo0J family partition protein [Burkholderia multivorans]AOK67862.1 chromosome partitioning protein ParB [Burkholderia multivorans]KVZ75287.1 chromosome partitioning protein ParB [Burkholderia multivorans]PRG73470.1 chromosome partitioning protein ParB [Burkholderia multivorans]
MNAINQAEVRAAAALEMADPTKNLILVPLGQLLPRHSKLNVRKTARRLSIPELAASISRVGLLQNLIVVLAADGEHYEVVAGDRRLTALKLLAKKKRIAADHDVPCLLVADASARTVSLAENILREAMHPADQFEAFAALVKEGRPVEDIAADFGVSPLVVQRRLKLANVSPRLIADYRAGDVTLEQLTALTITDDHRVQEAAFYDAPHWQRNAPALRERLIAREVSAAHPLARFVGLEAYTAAGGQIIRDLFAEDDNGIYLGDTTLLARLAQTKLDTLADILRAEGWAWVEAVPHLSHADRQAFHTARQHAREPNAREARRLASLQARIERTDAALDAAYEAEDEYKAATLQQQRDTLADHLNTLQTTLLDYTPDVRAVAGAIITVGPDGEAVTLRGLLREAEARALDTLERLKRGLAGTTHADDPGDGMGEPTPEGGTLSDRLTQRLSAHRTAALQIEIARHPQVALAALIHGMVQTTLHNHYYGHDLPLGVKLTVQDRLATVAPDWPESPAAVALRDVQQTHAASLPDDSGELFAALLAMSQDALVNLLAVCLAPTVDVVTLRAANADPGAELAQAVGLNMAAWWKPTAEGYFRHVSKAGVLDAAKTFAPSEVNRLAKLKKGDLATEAERLAATVGWMPAVFAQNGAPDNHPEDTGPDAAVGEDADTDDADEADVSDVPPHLPMAA